MKNSILTFVIILCATITVNAQNTQYANLQSGYNFANNTIAADYAKTGVLPAGYTTKTTQQICQQYGKEKMWVKYDQAAPANTVINGGHYANPAEVFIFTPEGNLLCAAKCGNYVNDVKFEGTIQVNVTVETQVVDTKPLEDDHDYIIKEIKTVQSNQVTHDRNMNTRFDYVDADLKDIRNAIGTNHTILLETRDYAAAAAKDARKAKNRATAGLIFSAVGATFSGIDLFNGDGRGTVQYVTNTIDSFNTTTNNNGTTTPTTGGPDLNGSN